MGRVVFFENAEQGRWLRPEALLREIAPHQPSDPSIVPDGPAIDPHDSVADRSGVVVVSSQRDILQWAAAANASSQGARMAARHDVDFIEPSIADPEADDPRQPR